MEKKLIIKAEYFNNRIKAVELKIIHNQLKIIQFMENLENVILEVPFSELQIFCNKKAIDTELAENNFGEIPFIEIGDYWIYPSFTEQIFAEIAPKNTFHSSIKIQDL